MKRKDNREKWYKLMQDYERSGKSVAEWCAEAGCTCNMFKYWRYRVRIHETYEPAKAALPDGWVIATPMEGYESAISIFIGGAKITVERGFDSLLLRGVVEALS